MTLVFITYALFASVFTVGKLALGVLPPFFLTALRYLIAGLIIFTFELFRGNVKKHPIKPHLPLIALIALFSVFLTNGLEFWGLQYLSSSKTCLFYSMSPFFSVILSYFLIGEVLSKKKCLGLFIGLVGFLALVLMKDSNDSPELKSSSNLYSLAEIAVSISALSAVIGWLYFKKLVVKLSFPINLANAYSFIIAGVIGMILALSFEDLDYSKFSENTFQLSWQVAYITIIHSVICYTMYANALKQFSVTFMSFAGISNPIFTAIYGLLFLGEAITTSFVACVALVSIGLYLFYQDEKLSNKKNI
ncbi:MAG: DMT family transporter [Chlamydiales bacterium]|nr:DMT family transporter [Chlamydiales bacterium]